MPLIANTGSFNSLFRGRVKPPKANLERFSAREAPFLRLALGPEPPSMDPPEDNKSESTYA